MRLLFPVFLRLGPVTIYSYGVALAAAFVAGFFIVRRELARKGMDVETAEAFVLAALVGGIVGARVLYVLGHLDDFRSAPLAAFAVWRAGLSFYGGLLGAALLTALVAKRRGMRVARVADVIAPALALGVAIGRLGCFSNGCCNGVPTGLPWAIAFADPLSAARPLGVPLHPTQLYESLAAFVAFAVLWRMRTRLQGDGTLFAVWLLFYSVTRFSVEFVRVNPDVLFGMSGSQLFSVLLIPASAAILWARLRSSARVPQRRAASV